MISFFVGCSNEPKQNADQQYLKLISEWDSSRVESLKSKTGWLNLAGLLWLKEGENKFGSGTANDIIFPAGKADEFIGSFYLADSIVTAKINEGVEVYSNGELIKEIVMSPDISGNQTELTHKNLNWFVIVRDDKIGIRLRDYDSETVKNFTGIDRFPVDTTWRISAKFVSFDPPKKITVPNIIGQASEYDVKGEIVFTKDGKEYSLTPIPSGENYFIIFADQTSGVETYGAGRFLYADHEDTDGNIVLDFNTAYNPPCAFSKYATCPLPPKENQLKLAVTAGEKNWGHH
ncbi:MAG: hypothetical protein A2068_00385 [Ignavibacteria bacterium GWB2_35_6b]|nr:MAG: hypothetical protein A2068_00385 [Ignavibacteria bacterium GWB2_35_6b]